MVDFLKICQVLLRYACELPHQTGEELNRGRKKHLARFTRLITAPSNIKILNFSFPFFIDVYWLYDDGGLTLLLPYILSTRTKYSRNKLRIFFLSNKVEKIEEETRNMAELMAKFRYNFGPLQIHAHIPFL